MPSTSLSRRYLSLGISYYKFGEYDEALGSSRQALSIFQKLDDRQLEAASLSMIGFIYEELRDDSQALDSLEQALPVFWELDDRQLEARFLSIEVEGPSLFRIGFIYDKLGRHCEAIDSFQKALGNLWSSRWSSRLLSFFSPGGEGIDFLKQTLSILRKHGDHQLQASFLLFLKVGISPAWFGLGLGDSRSSRHFDLLRLQQALAIYQEYGTREYEADCLSMIGFSYKELGEQSKAVDSLKRALDIFRELGNCPSESEADFMILFIYRRQSEAESLFHLGDVYYSLEDYPKALDCFQQALSIAREGVDRQYRQRYRTTYPRRVDEAQSLFKIGFTYAALKDYRKALDFLQQTLPIFRDWESRRDEGLDFCRQGEARSLNNIGRSYMALKEYLNALDSLQQALAIYQELGLRESEDCELEADSRFRIGINYYNLGEYSKALDSFRQALLNLHFFLSLDGKAIDLLQQALSIFQEIDQETGARELKAESLYRIGINYYNLGEYDKALDSLQQALPIFRELGDRQCETESLSMISFIYEELREYRKAIDSFQQALPIFRELGDRELEAESLYKIGINYYNLEEYSKALDSLQQALPIYPDAIDAFQQALPIFRELGRHKNKYKYDKACGLEATNPISNRSFEAITLKQIGIVYADLRRYRKALDFFRQALEIYQEVKDCVREHGDRQLEAESLFDLGDIYCSLEDYPKALNSFQQALLIFRELGDRQLEVASLFRIGLGYKELGEKGKALDSLRQALAICQEIGDQEAEAEVLKEINDLEGHL